MKSLIPNGMARSVSRQMLVAKKNSPHIFFVGGVLGVVTGAVLACRATLKLEDKLIDIQEEIDEVKDTVRDDEGRVHVTPENQSEYRKDLGRVYIRGAVSVGKLYGPSVVLGAVSIGALTGSHVQMTRRNSALTATVALVSQAYEEYRDRVREELGEERERDIHAGVTTEKRKIDGKMVDVKVLGKGGSPFSFMFTQQSSWNWKADSYYNRTFLEAQQNWATERLQSRGHLFLNELLASLGMEHTQEGAIMGWVYRKDDPNHKGDNYVDFGIFTSEKNLEFTEGSAFDVYLDFNVDGVIWDMI